MMILKNKVYDFLKWSSLVALPAISSLYMAIAVLWGLPKPQEVISTIAAVELFIGAIIGVSTGGYSHKRVDGFMNVIENAQHKKTMQLELKDAPEALESKKEVIFRVRRDTPETSL